MWLEHQTSPLRPPPPSPPTGDCKTQITQGLKADLEIRGWGKGRAKPVPFLWLGAASIDGQCCSIRTQRLRRLRASLSMPRQASHRQKGRGTATTVLAGLLKFTGPPQINSRQARNHAHVLYPLYLTCSCARVHTSPGTGNWGRLHYQSPHEGTPTHHYPKACTYSPKNPALNDFPQCGAFVSTLPDVLWRRSCRILHEHGRCKHSEINRNRLKT